MPIKHSNEDIENRFKASESKGRDFFGSKQDFGHDKGYRYFEYSDSRIFGLFRPILGAIFKIFFFIFGLFSLGFIVFITRFSFLKNLYDFVLGNLGLFFVMLFLFAYLDYFRAHFKKIFYFVSPFVNSLGPIIFLWVIANAILLNSNPVALDWVQQFASNYTNSIFVIYGIFVFIGYSLLLLEFYFDKKRKASSYF